MRAVLQSTGLNQTNDDFLAVLSKPVETNDSGDTKLLQDLSKAFDTIPSPIKLRPPVATTFSA